MQRNTAKNRGCGATIALLAIALGGGCSQVKPTETPPSPTATAPVSTTASSAKPSAPSQTATPSVASAASKSAAPEPAATPPKQAQAIKAPVAPKTATQSTVKTPPPAAKVEEKPVTDKPTAPVAAAAPATPTLDLRSLEQRLRDTRAIGMMTKLSIKNQVDDLLDDFRAFYSGKVKTPIGDLRQRYDLLLMKVLSLLQDSDVALASAISSSREAIWGILRDPKKFAEI